MRKTIPAVDVAMRRIGPKEAAALLDRNTNNRNVRVHHLDALARDMAEGRFEVNGDPIRISADGELLDGQHRLHAIVRSGVTCWMPVVTGLPRSVQKTMDIGAKRHAADALRFEGVNLSNLKGAAAVARAEILAEGGQRPTNTEIHERVLTDPSAYGDACSVANRLRGCKFAGGIGFYGTAYMRLRAINRPLAEDFFDQLTKGENLPAGSPLLLLRRRYQANSELRHMTNNPAALKASLSQIYAAWNAWRDGRPMTRRNTVDVVIPR